MIVSRKLPPPFQVGNVPVVELPRCLTRLVFFPLKRSTSMASRAALLVAAARSAAARRALPATPPVRQLPLTPGAATPALPPMRTTADGTAFRWPVPAGTNISTFGPRFFNGGYDFLRVSRELGDTRQILLPVSDECHRVRVTQQCAKAPRCA